MMSDRPPHGGRRPVQPARPGGEGAAHCRGLLLARGCGLSPGRGRGRRRGRRRDPSRTRGAALVEFIAIALFGLLPLALGVLQVGLLQVARHTLNYATFLAARAGAVSNGDRTEMQRHLARGLAPLYAGAREDMRVANAVAAGTRAYARAMADVLRPDRTRLRILNPTEASFSDFARRRDGGVEIPLDVGQLGERAGARSGQSLADATLLRVRVDRCQPLIVPIVDRLTIATLRRFDADPFRQTCYAAGAIAIRAHALVHMHSAPRRALMGALE